VRERPAPTLEKNERAHVSHGERSPARIQAVRHE